MKSWTRRLRRRRRRNLIKLGRQSTQQKQNERVREICLRIEIKRERDFILNILTREKSDEKKRRREFLTLKILIVFIFHRRRLDRREREKENLCERMNLCYEKGKMKKKERRPQQQQQQISWNQIFECISQRERERERESCDDIGRPRRLGLSFCCCCFVLRSTDHSSDICINHHHHHRLIDLSFVQRSF